MRTRTTILLLTLGTFLLTHCTVGKKNDSTSSNPKINKEADSVELTTLIRDIYTWYETDGPNPDFFYESKDSFLTGMDGTKNKERFEKIEKTGFFDKSFVDNLKDIADLIDGYIKNDTVKYETTLMPPWLDDVNDWCNCQGDPGGKWWETLTISGLRDDGDSADFNWSWGHDFFYHVRAKRINNKWKVSYLEGFEKKGYTIR